MVYRSSPEGVEYLVVHRPQYNDWSLPKGKRDEGESFRSAALREAEEETGYRCRVQRALGTVAYRTPQGFDKLVRYWLLEAGRGAFAPNPEVDEVAWLDFSEAHSRVSYPRDREVLAAAGRALREPDRGRVYLVRHAHAGDRSMWEASDEERPITKRGRSQARSLAALLSVYPILGILSSPHSRCVQTIDPLAQAVALDVRPDERLTEGADLPDTVSLLRELAGDSAVLCTHGDVVTGVLRDTAEAGARLEGGNRWEMGSTWVLDVDRDGVKSGTYLPPPSIEA